MDITNLLQWLIPSGGLGAVLIWLTNKTLRNLRTTKEIHDTYKQLYENIRGTLIEVQCENSKLHKCVSRLERAVSRASVCKYYAHCPINNELKYSQTDISKQKSQTRNKGNTTDDSCADCSCDGGDSDLGGEPP